MKKIKSINIMVLFLLLLFLTTNLTEGQTSAIDNGVSWLKNNQNPDGSWDGLPESLTTGFHTTAEVLNIFYHLGMTAEEAYLNGVQWMRSQDVSSFTDCFSRQVKILAESGSDVTGQLNTLLSYQNSDGGWSGYSGDSSEILDTILTLFALSTSSYSDTTVIGGAIDFILSGQNSDGSFGFEPGRGSVYLTSSVLLALSSYQYFFNITRNIENATDWLLSQQNPDGSFGTSIFETALAYSALVRTTIAHTQIQQTLEYIKSMQLENGSWNNDAFETALALRALADAKPNLTISSGDIVFGPASVYEGHRVRITATVRNSSVVEASNVVMRFYLGLPSGNIQIGTEQTISSIAGGSAGVVEVEWDTTGHAGVNDIYVVVDPDDAIDELEEGDNTRAVSIEVLTLPVDMVDIGILEVSFSLTYPTEGDIVIITGLIANQGQIDLANIEIGFYADGVDATNQIGSIQAIGMLSAGASGQVQVEWDTTSEVGAHTIYVVVDPGNKIGEVNESDNTVSSTIPVAGKVELPDFGVTGISLSNSWPMVGEQVAITAQIENKGLVGGGNILVRFYDGEPGKEGTVIIADRGISSLDSGAVGSTEVTWIATPQGSHKVYVVVDPDNTIPEGNELNNDSYVVIKVGLPDLFISSEDITFSNPAPFPNDIVILTVAVHNLMYSVEDVRIRFYDGNTSAGGLQIGQDQSISLLRGGEISYVSTDWIIPSAGIHSIYVIIDPLNIIEEWDETNNIDSRDIVVNAEFSGTISVTTNKTGYNAEEDVQIGVDITIDQLGQEFKTWTTKEDWESEGTTRTNIDTETSSGDVLLGRKEVTLDATANIFYHMDEGEGSNIIDSHQDGNTGTIHGATWTDGRFGKALNFDGVDDYVSIPHSEVFNLGASDFTISFWVKFASISGTQVFLGRNGPSDRSWAFYYTSGNLRFAWQGYSYKDEGFAWTPSANTWYQIVVMRSGADLKVYVNGSQVGSTYNIGDDYIRSASSEFYIGENVQDRGYYVNGTMDEVAIWGRKLSTTEIIALFYQGSSGYYSSGSIVLDFDSGSGGTNFKQLIWDKTLSPQQEFINDSGTVLLEHFNNTTTGTNYGYLFSGGRFGQGIYANDGSDKIFWLGSPPDSGTVEFWIYLSEDPTQDKNIFTNTNEYDYPYFVIRILQDRKIWTFYTNGIGRPQFTSLYPIQLNSWNFVSFGYGGSQTNKLWINGVLAGDGGEIKDLMPGWGGASVKYGFGRIYGRDDPIPGISNTYIDELRISNVRRNYHAELKMRIKVADTFEELNTAEWSSYFMNSTAVLDIPTDRYARIEATLETLEPSIPILHSLIVGYETKDITTEVHMEDVQGNVVYIFTPIKMTDYTLGGPKHYDLIWNTGNTVAGDYKAHAILKERGETKAESFAPFTIPLPEAKPGITSTVAIDKISYNSNQDVSIISKIVSQAINYTYINLTMREVITSPTNEIISTQEKSIPTLLPEQDITLTSIWNTGKNSPGTYAVMQHLITSTGETVDTETATFIIESTAETGEGILGIIEAVPAIVNEPTFDIVSTITNQGNVGLRGVILERLIIDPDAKEQVRIFTETIDLAIGETRDSIIMGIPVQGLSAKDYLLILNAVIDNKTYPLASGYVKIVIVIATIRIEPETFNKNTGEFTAFVQFPEGFDASTIRDTYCDGAPGVNYNYVPGKNEMIIKFRRDQITEVPLDIHFVVRGIFDSGLIFEGFDDIMKITE